VTGRPPTWKSARRDPRCRMQYLSNAAIEMLLRTETGLHFKPPAGPRGSQRIMGVSSQDHLHECHSSQLI